MPLLDRLYAAATQMTCTSAHAEDLVQQTYLRTLDAFGSCVEITDLRVSMFRILDDSALGVCGERQCLPNFDCSTGQARGRWPGGQRPNIPVPHTLGVQALERLPDHDVTAALLQLPRALRMVVYLADVEDFSPMEIAEILGFSLSAVTSRLRHGRLRLVQMLADAACRRGFLD
ncbi:RNA polymerase subunit sigma [Streptomyces sp. NBC_01799]|uniref:sigma factor-like helix-turn-helix DNA-binding protein n=1 Tax=Streptomyces sp. NBC_01800 TaxID=2975945 RepID=UPI002DDC0D1D|nr:sigma factor-like helix-turn-helix DNA-binding protein [Streptomyces sp. NBC_01800]WSA65664.1 RNA polymerase subunit sigma [Streptomyces sp. NBC_01800]WSA73453.1 RNA polymerase subunit sigma [Streptomyces sp. NBC_01800]WSA74279.1 RNA polymerase subunit sigma [Streptomyces sp. NBC_01799]WSA81968.1 RNA polymerase subunit sigma [Streptomyces sp. NBC_01799]